MPSSSLILVLNPGSTSLKAALFRVDKKRISVVTRTKIERADATVAEIFTRLIADRHITRPADLHRVAIRVVHGGTDFTQPTVLDRAAMVKLKKLAPLAPLHNTTDLRLISELKKLSPRTVIVGVFDTAFHATLPPRAAVYALPREYREAGVRPYGFHGIACQSIVHEFQTKFGHVPSKLVVCHLGGGASVTAILNGQSVETSMGFTPLSGLPMMTRVGDLDPAAINFLATKFHTSAAEVISVLNHSAGLFGLTGRDNFREIERAAHAGNHPHCALAFELFTYRIAQFVARSAVSLGGLEALCFSGGIGAGSAIVRAAVVEKLAFLGAAIDPTRNTRSFDVLARLSPTRSRIAVYATHVHENNEIARQVVTLLD